MLVVCVDLSSRDNEEHEEFLKEKNDDIFVNSIKNFGFGNVTL